MNERFFFDSDCDSHWYKIPETLRGLWEHFTVNDIDPEDYDMQREFEEQFAEYRIDGHPSRYSFEKAEQYK